ncbi:unnamed protein product [Moneuplotes crassus]|uniref:Uncharacterized protein n=1 Tax=Euplotes crassus TaxID=5936 RepID=A0AAD1XUX6_EUPCR|nr:unnamed protein product [Moneuplotes crassus]
MPNQTEVWFGRCFGRFNYSASLCYSKGIADLATTIGNGRNLSLSGSTISSSESQKGRFWAIFSMAKTILAYLA